MFVHNYVIAAGRNANPSSLRMSMEPVKLSEGMGIAIKSIAYGEVYNVSEINNSFTVRLKEGHEGEGNNTEVEERTVLEIPNGRYLMREHIMAAVKQKIDDYIVSLGHSNFTEYENDGRDILLKIPSYLVLDHSQNEIPISLIDAFIVGSTIIAPTGPMPEWTEMCFLYLNIVHSSFVNGRKSRLLSVFPIHARSGYSFYEFTNPTYVPIEVREFSEITVTLRNIKGSVLRISNKFDTVISLHVKSLVN